MNVLGVEEIRREDGEPEVLEGVDMVVFGRDCCGTVCKCCDSFSIEE